MTRWRSLVFAFGVALNLFLGLRLEDGDTVGQIICGIAVAGCAYFMGLHLIGEAAVSVIAALAAEAKESKP